MPTSCACWVGRRGTRSAWCRYAAVDAGAEAVRTAFDDLRKAGCPPRDRRCDQRRPSPHHWRRLRRAGAGHRRLGCGDGAARQPQARRGCSAKTGDVAADRRSRGGDRRKLLGSDTGSDRGDEREAPRPRHRPAGIRPRSGRRGHRVGEAEAGRGTGPDLRQRAHRTRSAQIHAKLGREESGALIERTLAAIAEGLVDAGVRRFVVAGGETSGAVVAKLGVTALRIGPEIEPGVPWTASTGKPPLLLALKSGNFGARDFFLKAFEVLRMSDAKLRDAIAQHGRRSTAPLRAWQLGQHQRAHRRRLPDNADQFLPRPARSRADLESSVWTASTSPATSRRRRPSCTSRCTRSDRRRPASSTCIRPTRWRSRACADDRTTSCRRSRRTT